MNPETLARQLLATFLIELDEHVAALNRDLLALERAAPDQRAELVHALFRTVHTIKGSSRAAAVLPIEAASHDLESALSPVRDGRIELTQDLIQRLFGAADAFADAAARLRSGQTLEGSSIESFAKDASQHMPPPSTAAAIVQPPASEELRVAVERFDALLTHVAEVQSAARRLDDRAQDLVAILDAASRAARNGGDARKTGARVLGALERFEASHAVDRRRLATSIAQLDADVKRVRMVPFAKACSGLARAVRDVAAATRKEVAFSVGGGDVELDRSVAERLRDPLLHLVRNAVDHGIELAEERAEKGKHASGKLRVDASLRGSEVLVEVTDDGRGVDLDALAAQSRARGNADVLEGRALARTIFQAGVTTARVVTEVSGRGVGLDIVRRTAEALHGSVDVSSTAEGTRFSILVPLTLTSIRAVTLRVGAQVFALPATSVVRLLRVSPGETTEVAGRDMVTVGGEAVPLVSLASVLGFEEAPGGSPRSIVAIAVAAIGRTVALAVDELLAEQEVFVKTLGRRLEGLSAVSGFLPIGDGRPGLLLNVADLIDRVRGTPAVARFARGPETRLEKPRVLLVDDSLTTRALERSILEADGYSVTVASDGAAAWSLLQQQGADAVVSDVEMPVMDGIALTEAIRSSHRFRHLPVVLVTALATEEDRRRGLTAGANAYLTKTTFDQKELLDTLAELVKEETR